ncbi:MAG: murein L,D-transpeptidase catalytic domain family protein [Flavobacteriales bacterium]|jgi:hypothetical protein|nr:murein L,D-transpeptidase catalytic domain family protein [Flavobacteriales bacterium]
MLKTAFISLNIALISCTGFSEKSPADQNKSEPIVQPTEPQYKLDTIRLQNKAKEALTYCKKNKMNSNYCVLIDMHIHSGRNRLFLWDFKANKIVLSGLCSHGCGDEPWGLDNTKDSPIFSNQPDSHLSSLGKYKIGKRGWSNWGIHVNYKLHGLDKTNSNAYKRIIVLHSWEAVEENETYPYGTPEGWGCPAINNDKMKELDAYLEKEKTPVLLWIYN